VCVCSGSVYDVRSWLLACVVVVAFVVCAFVVVAFVACISVVRGVVVSLLHVVERAFVARATTPLPSRAAPAHCLAQAWP